MLSFLSLLSLALLAGCGRPAPTFDNLVVVMVDTLRSDHLPSYGYERNTAPFLARLADEGIQLQGYAVTSWTRPSIASLLTGLHPQRHQTISRSDRLPPEAPYLPEILSREGFRTAAFISNLNVGRKWGFHRGFQSYDQWHGARKVDGARVTTRALHVARDLQSPYFLFVHYVDPHDPYRPRRPWGAAGRPVQGYVQPQALQGRAEPPTPEELRQLRDQYDGEILEMDQEIERLIRELRNRGLLERTLVVVTSDHGEEFGERGGLTHGRNLNEEVLKVPFVLWSDAGGRAGSEGSGGGLPPRRSGEIFYQLDFAPTMLEALGRPVPDGMDGLPRWRETVAGRSQEARDLFFHLDLEGNGALSLLSSSLKLLHTNRPPFNRLTDLAQDPGEAGPPLASEAEERRLLERLIGHHNALAGTALERRTTEMDPKLRRSLAALGYLKVDTPQHELEMRAIPPRLSPRIGLERLWEQRQKRP